MKKETEIFDEFFASGMEESISPFLAKKSRKWAKNIRIKVAIGSAFLLLLSYFFSYFIPVAPAANLCLLFTFVFAGVPALIGAVEDLFDFQINIDVLMTLAAFASIFIGSGKEGALLLVLFAISGAMEKMVKQKTKGTLSALKKILPTKALVVEQEQVTERAIRKITVGTSILIKPGEIIPLDGVVEKGECSLDISHLTGEAIPLKVTVGSKVVAGGKNLDGAITIKTTKASAESTLTKLIEMIIEAQKSKPKLQRWIDRFSSAYAFGIIVITFFLMTLFPLLGLAPFLGEQGSIYRSLAFLIAASPCALIIAIPTAYLSAVNSCAREGILLKGGICLDALARCRLVAVDKTGTLTQGKLICVKIGGELNPKLALQIAYGLEEHAIHPVAFALVQQAQAEKIARPSIEKFKVHPGLGVEGVFEGKKAMIGNLAFLQQAIDTSSLQLIAQDLKKNGLLYAFLLYDNQIAYFGFSDVVRKDAASTTLKILNQKIEVVMLTGDHEQNASLIASQLKISSFFANLSPEDKLQKIDDLNQQYHLAMVGDGMNDAPALARATVGIAMGQVGNAAAISAADIVFLHDRIDKLPWLFTKAKKTTSIVKQNVTLALSAIVVATTLSLLGMIPLWVAVVMHEGGTLIVGLNGLRLLRK